MRAFIIRFLCWLDGGFPVLEGTNTTDHGSVPIFHVKPIGLCLQNFRRRSSGMKLPALIRFGLLTCLRVQLFPHRPGVRAGWERETGVRALRKNAFYCLLALPSFIKLRSSIPFHVCDVPSHISPAVDARSDEMKTEKKLSGKGRKRKKKVVFINCWLALPRM